MQSICWEGGRGSRTAVHSLKMLFMVHCDFENGSQNQKTSKYFFGREGVGHKKTVLAVYALNNVDNSGRPLAATVTLILTWS